MKTLLSLVLVAVGVSGCMVYPAPYGRHDGGAYRYDGANRGEYPASRGYDQNRDGIPDRQQRARDSDRDGVPDRWDARPNDPRYR